MLQRQVEAIKRAAIFPRLQSARLALAHYRAKLASRVSAADGHAARAGIWIAVALFVLSFAWVATRTGMQVRDDAWKYSRSFRYHSDIANGYQWGFQVVQIAREEMAPSADALHVSPDFWQIVRAETRLYRQLLDQRDGGYDLDYPPVRLLTMSLWVRHVQRQFPYLSFWPGRWRQGESVNEDIAQPLLDINTLLIWLSSIFTFLLVWLWVDRGGRRGASPRVSLLGPRRPRWQTPTPLIDCAGLLLLPPLLCLFYYALLVAVSPCPTPPPLIEFSGAPVVSRDDHGTSALIRATINPEGAPTQWSVDWGTSPGDFSHSVSGGALDAARPQEEVSLTLPDLPPSATIHYRITARNDWPGRDLGHGTTRTDEAILFTGSDAIQPVPPGGAFGDVWPSLWQWLGIGSLFAALSLSIHWVPAEHRGWACGLLAAMLMWLNPAVLIVAHVWPQWDAWVLPPFLLALLLASLEWWFTAGIIFGLGTMFKGQFLIAAPVLLLWPLVSMRWGALLRMCCGILLSTSVLLSPWVVFANQPFSWSIPAIKWIVRVMIAVGLASLLPLLRYPFAVAIRRFREQIEKPTYRPLILLATAVAMILTALIALVLAGWPHDSPVPRTVALLILLAILLPPWLISPGLLGVFAAGITGAAIWMSAWLYHGDWAWESVGFKYAMIKHDQVAGGRGSMGNLAAILAEHFGFELHDPAIVLHLPNLTGFLPGRWLATLCLDGQPLKLDFRQTLIAIFAALVVACAAGATIQDRRNHPRFLAAMVAPWMLMPNILGQMMTRYQMWGAALSALLIGISRGFILVFAVFSVLAAGMIGNQLLGPARSSQLHQILTALAPDDGWIMLCMAVLVLAIAVIPGEIRDEAAPLPQIVPPENDPAPADEPLADSKISI